MGCNTSKSSGTTTTRPGVTIATPNRAPSPASSSSALPSQPDFTYKFKLLIIGDSNVGKSCVLCRFADNTFTEEYMSTIGIDYKTQTIELQNTKIKLQMWDTAGQERFRTITSSYYRGAHGILVVFDITSLTSFENVNNWLNEIAKHAAKSVKMTLVGNKCDLERDRRVPKERAIAFAKQHGIPYVETSARAGTNIRAAFECLTSEMLGSDTLKAKGREGAQLASSAGY